MKQVCAKLLFEKPQLGIITWNCFHCGMSVNIKTYTIDFINIPRKYIQLTHWHSPIDQK